MTALSMFCVDANRHQRAGHDTRLVDQTRRNGQTGRRSQHPGVERLAGLRGSGGQVVKDSPKDGLGPFHQRSKTKRMHSAAFPKR